MLKKIIATAVAMALVAICANAQEIRVDNKLFSTPTSYVELGNYKFYTASMEQVVEWFGKNLQADSLFVLNKQESNKYFVTKYYWKAGKKKQMVYNKPFVIENSQETVVFNQENQPVVVERKSDKIFFKGEYYQTETDQMSQEQKEQVIKGSSRAFDPNHKNYYGWDRHKWGIAVLGGANFVEQQFNPQVTLRWFYETCWLSYELEGMYSRAKHTEESQANGSYTTFAGSANVVFKAFQNRLKTTYFGIGLNAGYGLQKTDKDDQQRFYSTNYGFTGGGFVRFSASMAKNFRLLAEGGYKIYPKVLHTGGTQEFSCDGVYVNVGLAWLFNNQ